MTFRVLVTGASTPAGRSMIAALQAEPVSLLACDAEGCHCAVDDLPPHNYFAVGPSDSPECVGDLLALCVRHGVDLLVPTRPAELDALTRDSATFERLGTRIWLAPIPLHVTRSLARRITQSTRKRGAAQTVNDWWRQLNGVRPSA
jgi:hypothetical protein